MKENKNAWNGGWGGAVGAWLKTGLLCLAHINLFVPGTKAWRITPNKKPDNVRMTIVGF